MTDSRCICSDCLDARRAAATPLRRLKIIKGYAAHARWLSEVSDEPVGTIPRVASIPSPYAYSPTDNVWRWGDLLVIWREVSHRRYEVYEVPATVTLQPWS